MKYEIIKPYIEKKLISMGIHPENPDVRIFNYTQHCQFEGAWDEVTKQCRGLILNVVTGEIIARPFPKFFNYGEYLAKGWPVPVSRPEIYSKIDGSLGILYALDGVPYIATRGSFVSDQAIWATKWWRDNLAMLPENGETHLFEIIYPENRIVVNYDFSGLVHLATIDNATGKNIERYWGGNVRLPIRFDGRSLDDLAKVDEPNSEGFVIFFPEENVRMKIKHPEYVRLHKIITGVSEIGIWEMLRDEKDLKELLEKVPDEFFRWVGDVVEDLKDQYQTIWVEADTVAAEAMIHSSVRKEQAIYIQEHTQYAGVVFSMLDKKDYKLAIWRLIRPRGQSTFKADIDQ